MGTGHVFLVLKAEGGPREELQVCCMSPRMLYAWKDPRAGKQHTGRFLSPGMSQGLGMG